MSCCIVFLCFCIRISAKSLMAADRCSDLLDHFSKVVPTENVSTYQAARDFISQQSLLPDVRSSFSVRPQVNVLSMGSPPSAEIASCPSVIVPEGKGEEEPMDDVSGKLD